MPRLIHTSPIDGFRDEWGLSDGEVFPWTEQVHITDSRLARIVRFRVLGDPDFPYLDVSYIYGVLDDGTKVRVYDPGWTLRLRSLKRDIVAHAKPLGLYAKGLGLLDDNVLSILVA